jgi:hypothetical protein
MVGIAPDDDDGNAAASAPGPAPKAPQAPHRAEKPPLNRPAAIRKIAELGGDVGHAETLSDDALVAYGKALKSLPEPEQPPEPRKQKGDVVTVTGVLTGTPYVSDKVCKFSIADEDGEHNVAVFPQRSCWHQVVNREGEVTIENEEVVSVTGKVKHDEKYGSSIIADEIVFGE